MKRAAAAVLLACAALAAQPAAPQWTLAWSDEFNGPTGAPPDPAKWNFDLGATGWGNNEIETYTDSPANVFQNGHGSLVIRAIRDSAGRYTSARLQTGSPVASTHTADLSWQFGRIEARIKLPFGKAVWPAFWMLGENIGAIGWPGCGEIDIMENFGTYHNNLSVNNGSAHGPGYSGGNSLTRAYAFPAGETVSSDYHVYAVEWSRDSVEWSVDRVPYFKVTPASLPAGARWVFNAPFFLLLNLAIGGPKTFLGTPDPNAPFPPQDMLVDYVRVYRAAPAAPPMVPAPAR